MDEFFNQFDTESERTIIFPYARIQRMKTNSWITVWSQFAFETINEWDEFVRRTFGTQWDVVTISQDNPDGGLR